MSSTRKMFVPLAAAVAIAAAAAGCSSSGSDTGSTKAAESGTAAKPSEQAAAPLAPVTIKVLDSGGGYFGEADFKILLADPVKKKYPHITVERIAGKMQDMLTTGEAFDFFATWNGEIPTYKDAGIYTDITPMAQKSKFDLSRFNQAALDSLRIYGDKGELFAVPYAENIGALYYNKDLFDKFGVGYPGDGMSWEDAVNLGKRMTRQEGGVQYQGIFSQIGSLFSQLSLQFVESGTNKVLVADELYSTAPATASIRSAKTGHWRCCRRATTCCNSGRSPISIGMSPSVRPIRRSPISPPGITFTSSRR
ncbi:MAG: family 1 extracellular solute-binding protein [Paenibacillus sp.]|nr:family 1 extracellular solute-binding protein [Paenibacillus sp.]